ncbi:MAG: histidine phosphatase family protein [Opitutus sp.]|nr:histidine phosphatase family protein [Opitutus sp.]
MLRHTRLAGAEGLCYGRTDVALAGSFADEVAVIRAGLAGVRFGAVWSSPAARCQRLAVALIGEWHGRPARGVEDHGRAAHATPIPDHGRDAHATPISDHGRDAHATSDSGVPTDARLQELNFGAWENCTWDSFRSPESEAWALDSWSLAPPGGESGAQLWARVAAVRGEILGTLATGSSGADGASVLVVTHAGVIRAWLGLERGLGWAEAMCLPVPHGSLTVIDPCGRQATGDKF